jgi:DNA-binding transcriptional LysR family regulator
MSVLLAVVEEGSLSAGARRLRAPLATVSRKVNDLERHLNTRLLVRTSRRVELTEAGRDYVAASRSILRQLKDAERAAAGEYSEPRGELVVTAPVVFGRRHVLPIAITFLERHPDIDLTLLMADRLVNIVEEHVDAAVRIGRLPDSGLIATRVGSVRQVVCASPLYLARHGAPRAPEDLPAHDGIAFGGMVGGSGWTFRREGRSVEVEPRRRLLLNTTEPAIEAALAGFGLTRVPDYQIRGELLSGELVELLAEYAPDPLPVSLVYPDLGLMPLKLRSFLDWSAPRLRAALA